MQALDFAKKVSKKAGKLLGQRFAHLSQKDISYKGHYEIVTRVDYDSERIILEVIKKHYPNHTILSEESGKISGESDYLWLIDPLDGTTNYWLGSPVFGISLALAKKNEIQFALNYIPMLDRLYEAEVGKGTKLNGQKIHVSNNSIMKNSLVLFCHGNRFRDIRKIIQIYSQIKIQSRDSRQLGSAVWEFGLVASGLADAFLLPGANLWDAAAGALLVREAGGRVTDFAGKEWHLGSKDLLASNGKIHDKLLKIVNKKK